MATLYDLLTAPGATDGLRWAWLRDCPAEPAQTADVDRLRVPNGEVRALSASVATPQGLGRTLTLTASVPVPPAWAGSPGQAPLGGLALLSASGDLLHLIWVDPPARPDTLRVEVDIFSIGGPGSADA